MSAEQQFLCKYKCGKMLKWGTHKGERIEVDTNTLHDYNRCLAVKEQKKQSYQPQNKTSDKDTIHKAIQDIRELVYRDIEVHEALLKKLGLFDSADKLVGNKGLDEVKQGGQQED
jgi:hypothetical protein